LSFQLAPSISVLRIMRDGAWAWAVLLGVGVVDGDGDGRMVGPCGCRSVGVLEGVEQGEGERGRWACVA